MIPKIHWLGRPVKDLPVSCSSSITEQFNIEEYGDDFSILSDPNVRACLFFVGGNNAISSQCISTLCKNLTKRLIVLITSDTDAELPDTSVTDEVYTFDQDSFSDWLSGVEKQYFSCEQPIGALHPPNDHQPDSLPKGLTKVLQFLDKNLNEEIREEEVAAMCHYSTTYFSRYFHKHIGVSFRDYVIDKRIALAKQLLIEQPNIKVAYIAYQCGYQDTSYFARIFKKRVGVSPATYRQQLLKSP
ncbi:helix-turn-helix domain-containing protein [Vibrio japonicus]|uniref:AraC family transcriptional regulator n=1 Tax=Vibrio japonicus TaxID=1824638 RepID=A0ABY5LDI4_9VIBR|nr:AraC family transcriptional regulator [Vibrio japonicus]UUM30084.1 AraC family transcriptional regulator [Vibrio japonicus]